MASINKINLRSHFHSVYDLQYHLVLVTKYRRKCFTKEVFERLKVICKENLEKWDVELLEFGGEEDHIHLLIKAHPSLQLSNLVNNLKTVTSRLLRKEYSEHLAKFYWKPVLWTRAYCILSTGGATIDTIKKYIESQKIEDDGDEKE